MPQRQDRIEVEPGFEAMGNRLRSRLATLLTRVLAPNPTGDRAARHSMIHAGPDAPSDRLLDLALEAVRAARTEDLSAVVARIRSGPRWPEIWPGEHYRLLAGLVKVMAPRIVIEIGTYRGMSALTLAKNLPAGAVLHTFDLAPWDSIGGQCLVREDFADGRIVFDVADLGDRAGFEARRRLFESADLIFVDAAKDGRFEPRFLAHLEGVSFARPPIVVFDDVRLWKMLKVWRDVRRPKLDLVSFGHWTGTGLIDWQPAPAAAHAVTAPIDRARVSP